VNPEEQKTACLYGLLEYLVVMEIPILKSFYRAKNNPSLFYE
jgi:hypothetical protein